VKFLPGVLIASAVQQGAGKRNFRVLANYVLLLVAMISIYAVLFHMLMEIEGRRFSWISGFYWTLTVMSTLGFGDITFEGDLGRIFSMLVLISGMVFLLVLLPFIFIQFFWAPWMAVQSAARAPRQLPEQTSGHVILTHYDAVTATFIDRLVHHRYRYVLLVSDLQEALRLKDLGVQVVVGDLDNPVTYERVRVNQAALVATTCSDFTNSNVAFTVRSVSPNVPIIGTAHDPASVDVLELAGCNHVLELAEALGQSLARRTIGSDAMTHVIGQLGPLLIAEATTSRTPLRVLSARPPGDTDHHEHSARPGRKPRAARPLRRALRDLQRLYLSSGNPRRRARGAGNRTRAGRKGDRLPHCGEESGTHSVSGQVRVGKRGRAGGAAEGRHHGDAGGHHHDKRRRHERLPHNLLPPAAT
jgi:voltage-gated potassium channel Kch